MADFGRRRIIATNERDDSDRGSDCTGTDFTNPSGNSKRGQDVVVGNPGAVPVPIYTPGTLIEGSGSKSIAGTGTPQEVDKITLSKSKNYYHVLLSAYSENDFEFYLEFNNNGTPAQKGGVLSVGPGQKTFVFNFGPMIAFTSGGSGDQELKLMATQKTGSGKAFYGHIAILEKP